jgi:hypothetical protein
MAIDSVGDTLCPAPVDSHERTPMLRFRYLFYAFLVGSASLSAQATWKLLSPKPSPSARYGHAMVYDLVRKRVLLVGGTPHKSVVDIWVYGARSDASYVSYGKGCRGSAGSVTLAASSSGPWIGSPFSLEPGSLPSSGAAVLFFGASRSAWGSLKLPLALAGLGMPGCSLQASPDLAVPPTLNGCVQRMEVKGVVGLMSEELASFLNCGPGFFPLPPAMMAPLNSSLERVSSAPAPPKGLETLEFAELPPLMKSRAVPPTRALASIKTRPGPPSSPP